jgi:hypothetical protein
MVIAKVTIARANGMPVQNAIKAAIKGVRDVLIIVFS